MRKENKRTLSSLLVILTIEELEIKIVEKIKKARDKNKLVWCHKSLSHICHSHSYIVTWSCITTEQDKRLGKK